MDRPHDPSRLAEFLATWLGERVDAAGARGAVFGLSGGVDSSVVCGLAARALGAERCLGLIMPIGNVAEDEQLANVVAQRFRVRTLRPDLLPAFDALEATFREEREAAGLEATSVQAATLASANIKPRLRMIALYFFANLLNHLVVGTGNRAELTVGYYTKYGDAGVDLLPLADLTKAEVRAVARELGIPERVLERPPSAGLWHGQTDEEELGITYAAIDRFIRDGSTGDETLDREIRRRYEASRHKRELPPIASIA